MPATRNYISSSLSGVAGEYYVAAELSRRGCIASVTPQNAQGIDILASDADGTRQVGIQVKTNKSKHKKWTLAKKAEDFRSKSLFYVFVTLKNGKASPEFHIVPSAAVAKQIKETQVIWLAEPGKSGKSRKSDPMKTFFDYDNEYMGRWDILGLGCPRDPEA